jgi:uncharacterized protein
MPQNVPWTPDVVCYHGNCDDGFCAAWIAWQTVGERGDKLLYVPCFYGAPLPLDVFVGKNVLFVDFSPKLADIGAMFAGGAEPASVVILDHHKTAMAALEPFTFTACGGAHNFAGLRSDLNGMFSDLCELNRPPVLAFFDMEKSGARIALEFFGNDCGSGVAPMVALIEDRDLWRFKLGDNTKNFSAALRSYAQHFGIWDNISYCIEETIQIGVHISRAHSKNVTEFCKQAYFDTTLFGESIPMVNVPYHYASDCAHELLKLYPKAPFVAAWFVRGDKKVQWSLRSEDHRADVSEIAKRFGGGGHRNAAGFECDW